MPWAWPSIPSSAGNPALRHPSSTQQPLGLHACPCPCPKRTCPNRRLPARAERPAAARSPRGPDPRRPGGKHPLRFAHRRLGGSGRIPDPALCGRSAGAVLPALLAQAPAGSRHGPRRPGPARRPPGPRRRQPLRRRHAPRRRRPDPAAPRPHGRSPRKQHRPPLRRRANAKNGSASGGAPTQLAQNCSGKHAAMAATCVINGWPVQGYLDPGHPLQKLVAGHRPRTHRRGAVRHQHRRLRHPAVRPHPPRHGPRLRPPGRRGNAARGDRPGRTPRGRRRARHAPPPGDGGAAKDGTSPS